jgi:DnaJ-class molecular chaperone
MKVQLWFLLVDEADKRLVLTDPQKRAVYDMFGEEGLRTSWEVGPRLKTPEEVCSAYVRI